MEKMERMGMHVRFLLKMLIEYINFNLFSILNCMTLHVQFEMYNYTVMPDTTLSSACQ